LFRFNEQEPLRHVVRGAKRIALYYPWHPGMLPEIIQGIFRYIHTGTGWELYLSFQGSFNRLLKHKPDGIIGAFFSAREVAQILSLSIPVVGTTLAGAELNVPQVTLDDQAIGVLAAEYFLGLGFGHFLYVGERRLAFAQRRYEGFMARLHQAGHAVLAAPSNWGVRAQEGVAPVSAKVVRWLGQLPRPIAAFAAEDAHGLQVIEAGRDAGLRVPEDLAVLGVGNSSLLCSLAMPPLSSVRVDAEATGHEAARLLDQLLRGASPPAAPVQLPPLGVVSRRSTDVYAVADADLAAALIFIRDNARLGIGVEDVVRAVGISRSTLERRFRSTLSRSPLEEIRRVQVERAQQLLVETDWPMLRVARESGLRDGRHLTEIFRLRVGATPTAYRRRFHCFFPG
jgi:LacI family transcriptional regulator